MFKLGKEFLNANQSINNLELKYIDFVCINDFTKNLEVEINEDFKFIKNVYNNEIDKETNLVKFFSKGKILGPDDTEKSIEDIISHLERGSCLTHRNFYLFNKK